MKHKVPALHDDGHDTAAELMIDGELVAACEQKRCARDKHSRLFPSDAIRDRRHIGGVEIGDLEEVAVCHDPIFGIRGFYLKPALASDQRLRFTVTDFEGTSATLGTEHEVRRATGYTGIAYRRSHCVYEEPAEFSPRALSNRSVRTHPFPNAMKDMLNRRVKIREDFRPFPPAALAEHTKTYFDIQ